MTDDRTYFRFRPNYDKPIKSTINKVEFTDIKMGDYIFIAEPDNELYVEEGGYPLLLVSSDIYEKEVDGEENVKTFNYEAVDDREIYLILYTAIATYTDNEELEAVLNAIK
jgi:hypothetical protein